MRSQNLAVHSTLGSNRAVRSTLGSNRAVRSTLGSIRAVHSTLGSNRTVHALEGFSGVAFLLPLMNSFNKTGAGFPPCRLCFLRAFLLISLIYFDCIRGTNLLNENYKSGE